MNVAVLHANHLNNAIIKGAYLLGWHYHNDHNIHSLSNYGQRVQDKWWGRERSGEREKQATIDVECLYYGEKVYTFKIILKIW